MRIRTGNILSGLAILLVLFGCQQAFASQAKPVAGNSFKVVDVMPAFWQFWQKAENADESVKVKLFRETVIQPHKAIFEGFTGSQSDAGLADYLKNVKPLLPRMHKLSDQFLADFLKYKQSFDAAFPDMRWDGTVCFMPNFGVTDAGTGRIAETSYLLFEIDTIAAQYGENANLATLFHHELFHVYHGQLHPEWQNKNRNKGEIPLYWLLWSEGLVTYVSQVLNPQASLDQVLLSKSLAKNAAPVLASLCKDLRENLTSTSTDYLFDYLSAEPKRKEIPPRAGYYVGMMVAQELGRNRSPSQLARMGGDELLRQMNKALLDLERAGKPDYRSQ